MARIRTIKPNFFRSIPMSELPISTRMTFIGLWTYVDDDGRGVDDVRLIKSELWPLDRAYGVAKVERDLTLLHAKGLIQRYSVGTRDYLAVISWKEHQKINHPQKSTIPDPASGTERSVNVTGTVQKKSGAFPEESLLKGKERKGNILSALEEADDTSEEDRPEIVEMCNTLADYVGQFLGSPVKRPSVTARWHKDMRLLIDRGPLGRDQSEPLDPQRIQRCMETLFTKMAEPERNGFCWAAQVRSPHALREHWDQISSAWQRASNNGSNNEPEYWIDAFGNKVYS